MGTPEGGPAPPLDPPLVTTARTKNSRNKRVLYHIKQTLATHSG